MLKTAVSDRPFNYRELPIWAIPGFAIFRNILRNVYGNAEPTAWYDSTVHGSKHTSITLIFIVNGKEQHYTICKDDMHYHQRVLKQSRESMS